VLISQLKLCLRCKGSHLSVEWGMPQRDIA
jgi:hypothetical protein